MSSLPVSMPLFEPDVVGSEDLKASKHIEELELATARTALHGCPSNSAKYTHHLKALFVQLNKVYKTSHNLQHLEESISVLDELCTRYPAGHEELPGLSLDLARTHRDYYIHSGEISKLLQSAAFYRVALSQRLPGSKQCQRICGSLASVLARLYAVTDKSEFLEEAIKHGAASSRLRLDRYSRSQLSPDSLALKLSHQSWTMADSETLQYVITMKRKELSGYSSKDVFRASCCSELAGHLLRWFRETGDETVLDEAIVLNREALALYPVDYTERARYCGYLADALCARHLRTADDSVLQEAKTLAEESLSLRPPGHPEYAHSCTRMANILLNIARLYNDPKSLEEALVLHDRALCSRNIGNPQRGHTLSRMGEVYLQKYFWTSDVRSLHEACVAIREEMALRPPGHRYWATARVTYAVALYECYKNNDNEDDLRKAIDLCHESATIARSRNFALARVSIMYLKPLTSVYKPSMAISCLEEVLQANPQQTLGIWTCITNAFDALLTDDILHQHAASILHLLRAAMDWLPLLVGFVLNRRSQLQILRRADRTGWQALTVALSAQRHAEGIELLDRARGFMWSQALHINDPQVQTLPPGLAAELDPLMKFMALLSRSSDGSWSEDLEDPTQRDLSHNISDRIQGVLYRIRSLPGLDRFMLGLPYSDLKKAGAGYPVIVLTVTGRGCHAWIIGAHGWNDTDEDHPLIVNLPITPEELGSLTCYDHAGSRRGSPVSAHRKMRLGHVPTRSEVKLCLIWDRIVKPVIDGLELTATTGRARPRLVWCPTGDFSFLPLHAAGYYEGVNRQCCSDFFVSSYTPTLAALLRAQDSPKHPPQSKLKLLLVGETKSPSLPRLHHVKTELELVSSIARQAHASVENIEEENAETSHVMGKLETAHLVHLACHGIQDTEDALASGFFLKDGRLTISRLMDLTLETSFFAFLSACETAHGDEAQPDEVVHLAAAMLFAGFRSIVATMWAMNDADGPSIAEYFYTELFKLSEKHIMADDVPFALDAAVAKLRDSGLPVERWATFVHIGA